MFEIFLAVSGWLLLFLNSYNVTDKYIHSVLLEAWDHRLNHNANSVSTEIRKTNEGTL